MKNFVISKNATKLEKCNMKPDTCVVKTPYKIQNDAFLCTVVFSKKRPKFHQNPSES